MKRGIRSGKTTRKEINLKIESRRQRVFRLYGKGLSQSEIGRVEKIDRATVERDLVALRKKIKAKFDKKDLAETLAKIEAGFETNLRELWKLHAEAKNENVKLGCLKQVNDLTRNTLEVYQKLGVIARAPEEIIISKPEDTEEVKRIFERARKLHLDEERDSLGSGESGDD